MERDEGQLPVEQQDLDHGACAGGIAEPPPGSRPEALVGTSEGAGPPRLRERERARQGTGLAHEDLQIMVQQQGLAALPQAGLVTGDQSTIVKGLHPARPEAHRHLAAGQACRDRIPALPHAHAGLAIDPRPEHQRRVEGFGRKRPKVCSLIGEGLPDRLAPAIDAAGIVTPVGGRQEHIELGHRGHGGHGHEMPSPEAADLAFDAALLVGATLAGYAEEGIEAEVRAEEGEAVGLDPVAALEHPGHRAREVVIADPRGQATETLEGDGMAFQEGGLLGRQEGQRDGLARARQTQMEEVDRDRLSGQADGRLAKIDLGLLAGRMAGHDGHRADGPFERRSQLADVLAHRGLGHRRGVLLGQALPDAPRRVALLARRGPVLVEPRADDGPERRHQRGRPDRHDTWRRQGRCQRLADRAPMDVVVARQGADGHPFLPMLAPDNLE